MGRVMEWECNLVLMGVVILESSNVGWNMALVLTILGENWCSFMLVSICLIDFYFIFFEIFELIRESCWCPEHNWSVGSWNFAAISEWSSRAMRIDALWCLFLFVKFFYFTLVFFFFFFWFKFWVVYVNLRCCVECNRSVGSWKICSDRWTKLSSNKNLMFSDACFYLFDSVLLYFSVIFESICESCWTVWSLM